MGMTVHKSLFQAEKQGPEKGSLMRCPHCSKHFFEGGEVKSGDGGKAAKEFDREHQGAMTDGRETDEYDDSFDHYYEEGEAGFAKGGLVDGAGKVDGIHNHPSECSHLSAGGVCRHLAPNRRRPPGEDYADHKVRNFARGGRASASVDDKGAESFGGFLAKRRAVRGAVYGRD